jgi:WD40 repeat protein
VTSGKDGTIHIWDTKSGAELLSPVFKELVFDYLSNPATVYSVVFTPDGNQLITACWDQSFRVWDATPVNRRFTAYKGAPLSREDKP